MPPMAVMDFHTHAFPDSLAPRAIAHLESQASHAWRAKLDGRVSSLLASMDAAGIARSVVCPIATKPEHFEGILKWCLAIRSARLVPLASMHPGARDVAGEVRQIAEAGLLGIKLHPMYQDFNADDPHLDPLYAAAARHKLLLVLHCGFDIAYADSTQAHPHRVAAVHQRHPELKLVATHLGGFQAWDEVRRHLLGQDVWMETSFSLDWMEERQALEIIRGHGTQRILFGTDSPWAEQSSQIALLEALPLSAQEKSAILGSNGEALLAAVARDLGQKGLS
jgi:uncharacterized protein